MQLTNGRTSKQASYPGDKWTVAAQEPLLSPSQPGWCPTDRDEQYDDLSSGNNNEQDNVKGDYYAKQTKLPTAPMTLIGQTLAFTVE